MRFRELELNGAFLIEPELLTDERGFFARSYCAREFAEHGLMESIAQCNISFNEQAGTLRGLHFQRPPHSEAKVVRCTRGAIWDVIVDLREDSPTHCSWFGAELTADNRRMLYVPKNFAHGFVTLEDASEVFYHMSDFYVPGSGDGVRWDDPAFGIEWPREPAVISDRDATYDDFERR